MKEPNFEQEQPESEAQLWGRKAKEAFREIIPRAEGGFGEISFGKAYMSADYTDGQGRNAEVRLLQSDEDPSSFTLNANIGKALALVELKERLEEKGIRIDRLVSYFANDEERKILDSLSKKG